MICIFCKQNNTKKKGKYLNYQNYYCNDCKRTFNETTKNRIEIADQIYEDYVFHKQSYDELKNETGLSKVRLRNIVINTVLPKRIHNPRTVVLVVDASYIGKRHTNGSWGVLVFKDAITKEVLWFKYFDGHETSTDYLEGKLELQRLGYAIYAVVGDGFSGIYQVFKEFPIQFCHFHIKQLIKRYTMHHRTSPHITELLEIIDSIPFITEELFKHELFNYMHEYDSFINEKRTLRSTHRSYFVRKDLRALIRSLITNISHLFVYRKYVDYKIPNTTNTLEAMFKHIKKKLRVHDGLHRNMKEKIISTFLLNSSAVKK